MKSYQDTITTNTIHARLTDIGDITESVSGYFGLPVILKQEGDIPECRNKYFDIIREDTGSRISMYYVIFRRGAFEFHQQH